MKIKIHNDASCNCRVLIRTSEIWVIYFHKNKKDKFYIRDTYDKYFYETIK